MSEFKIAKVIRDMVPSPAANSVVQITWNAEDGILSAYGTAAITVLNLEAAGTYAPGCTYTLVSGTSSKTYINQGAAGVVAVFVPVLSAAEAAALTTALTDITHTAPGTPDFALQDLVQNTGFGFVTADEGNTVLSVILNNQTRIAEIETALSASGLLP